MSSATAPELTDAEVDSLLERFDQTAPALQRRIVACFVAKVCQLDDALRYAGFGEPYPHNRLPLLLQQERAKCRNQDGRDYWRFVEEKLAALIPATKGAPK